MRDRIYQFSSNRGAASHRVRYVEGARAANEDAGECRLCAGSLFIQETRDAKVRGRQTKNPDVEHLEF